MLFRSVGGGRGSYRSGKDVRPCPRRWRQAFQAVAGLHHDRAGPRIKIREDLRPKRMRGLHAGIVPFRYDDGERHSTARQQSKYNARAENPAYDIWSQPFPRPAYETNAQSGKAVRRERVVRTGEV